METIAFVIALVMISLGGIFAYIKSYRRSEKYLFIAITILFISIECFVYVLM